MTLTLTQIDERREALDLRVEDLCAAAEVHPSTFYKNVASPDKVTDRILRKLERALVEFEVTLGAPELRCSPDDLVPRTLAYLDFNVTGNTLHLNGEVLGKIADRINEQCERLGCGALHVARVETIWSPQRFTIRPWFWIERGSSSRVTAAGVEVAGLSNADPDPWRTDMRSCPPLELVEFVLRHKDGFGARVLGYRSEKLGYVSSETKKVVHPVMWRPAAGAPATLGDFYMVAGALTPAAQVAAE